MISFSGYGLIVVLVDYFGGLFLLSKYSSYFFKTERQQYIALLLFHIIISCINFVLIKYLNRKEVKHMVYGIRLEIFVFVIALIFLPFIIMMGKDIIY